MIQIISLNNDLQSDFENNKNIDVKTFSDYESFDRYDVNIINLNSPDIWEFNDRNVSGLNIQDDLIPLKQSIKSSKAKTIILMPQNYTFYYYYMSYDGHFLKSKQLKSISQSVSNILNDYICDEILEYTYERCKTTINGFKFNSDFYFNDINTEDILLTSDKGNKVNTYFYENVIITTLNVLESNSKDNAYEKLNSFITAVCKPKNKEAAPSWIEEVKFFGDEKYLDNIEQSKKEIERLEKEINENKLKLDENNKVKSILYETGTELNKEIVNILEDILKEHNEFKDIYEEDYKFISDNTTFIVETKGLNNEVSGQNVTDAFSHLTIYEDKLEQENKVETTKCLFFVASQRKLRISERKKVNQRQETIAKRNNTLIIDTPTFLNIYEDFLNQKISKDEIIKIFKEQFGVINYDKKDNN